MFGGQIAIIFVGGRAFSIVPITGVQWAICIGLAFLSCPWAMVIRSVPDVWAEKGWRVAGAPVKRVLGAGWHAVAGGCLRVLGRKKKVVNEEEV